MKNPVDTLSNDLSYSLRYFYRGKKKKPFRNLVSPRSLSENQLQFYFIFFFCLEGRLNVKYFSPVTSNTLR